MNGSGAATKFLRRFEDARAGRQLLPDLCDNSFACGPPTEPFSFRPRTGQPGLDPFLNDVRLELGEDGDHPEHRLSGWRVVRIGFRRCSAEFQFPSPSLKAVTVQTGIVLSSAFVVSRPNCSSIPVN